jgi:hypothetical protein
LALGHSPRIVMDGLVLCLDGANYKSFKGEATTNVVTNTNLDTGWSKTYNTNIQWNDYPPPDNVNSQVVSFVDSDGNGSGYWYSYGDYAPQSPSTTYTISVYARTVGSSWNIRAYTADNSETGRQFTNIVTVPGDGKWHRVVFNSITTPADTQSDSLSFNFQSIPAGQRCWLCAPQMEAKSYATTFTTGTRGTTVATGGGWKNLVGSNNGELVNGVRESTDDGGSLVFDGVNDYVQKSSATLDLSSGVTMEMIFKSTDMNSRAQGFMQFNAGGYYVNFYTPGNGKLRWETWVPVSTAGGAYYTPTALSNNTWYHAVGTYTNGSSVLYINGSSVASASQTAGTYPSSFTANIRVGQYAGYMSGNIAIAKMYNRALTAAEVKQNFDAHKGRYGL